MASLIQSLSNKRIAIESLFDKKPSFSDIILYDEFIKDRFLFLKDGSVGFTYQFDGIYDDCLTSDEFIDCQTNIIRLFELDYDTSFQIYNYKVSKKNNKIKNTNFESLDKSLVQMREDQINKSLRQNKILLFIKVKLKKESLSQIIKKTFLMYKTTPEILRNELLIKVNKLEETLDDYEIKNKKLQKLHPSEITKHLYNLYNKVDFFRDYKFNNVSQIDKLISSDIINVHKDTVKVGNVYNSILSLKVFEKDSEHKSSIDNKGIISSFLKNCIGDIDYIIINNISKDNKNSFNNLIANYKQYFTSPKERDSLRQLHRDEALRMKNDLKNGDSYLSLSFHIIVFNDNYEKLQKQTKELQYKFESITKARLIREKLSLIGLYYSLLPFHYDSIMNPVINRSFLDNTKNLVPLMPLYTSYEGHNIKDIVLNNRDDMKIPFSLFETQGAGHTVILAYTGAGKSTFQLIIESFLRVNYKNSYVFKLDFGTTSDIYTIYDESSETNKLSTTKIDFNPFRGKYTESKKQFLVSLITRLITLNSEKGSISNEKLGLISKAIDYSQERAINSQKELDEVKFYQRFNNEILFDLNDIFISIEIIANEVRGNDSKKDADEIRRKLSIFLEGGIYNNFFSDSESNSKEKNYVIYDFEGLNLKNPITSVISLCVCNEIEERINQIAETKEDIKGLIVLEEIRSLGDSPEITEFFKGFSERVRKKGFRVVSTSPNFMTFFDTEIGRAALVMAEQYLFGYLGKDKVSQLVNQFLKTDIQDKKLKKIIQDSIFNEATIQILMDLKKREGDFTEFLYINLSNEVRGIIKFVMTSLEIWLSASGNDRSRKEFYKTYEKFKQNKVKTINHLITKYPRGL